ncbi:MAG: hypothetical protein P8O88_04560 [Flavobacteriaceae bacterium]|nr:hypothetical protein [Flavobacteriaceae bacterium]
MSPEINKSLEFELPIVPTKELLQKDFKNILQSNRDLYILDLGYKIEIFEYFPPNYFIEEEYVKSITEFLLLQVANAYKWVDEEVLFDLLYDYADKIRKKSLGGVIPKGLYKDYVLSAIANKDTIEVEINKTVRYLTNPYYEFKEGEYLRRGQLKVDLINKALAKEKLENNYKIIYDFIADYDLNLGAITKKLIAKKTGLSYASIKNYFRDNLDLQILFVEVNNASKTELQKKNSKYYLNRISKKAK